MDSHFFPPSFLCRVLCVTEPFTHFMVPNFDCIHNSYCRRFVVTHKKTPYHTANWIDRDYLREHVWRNLYSDCPGWYRLRCSHHLNTSIYIYKRKRDACNRFVSIYKRFFNILEPIYSIHMFICIYVFKEKRKWTNVSIYVWVGFFKGHLSILNWITLFLIMLTIRLTGSNLDTFSLYLKYLSQILHFITTVWSGILHTNIIYLNHIEVFPLRNTIRFPDNPKYLNNYIEYTL